MRFTNDPRRGFFTPDEVLAMNAAMRQFHTQEEVRFATDASILPVILNVLAKKGAKFYLIHLPGGAGWVLRRNRPTGEFYGAAPEIEPPVSGRVGGGPAFQPVPVGREAEAVARAVREHDLAVAERIDPVRIEQRIADGTAARDPAPGHSPQDAGDPGEYAEEYFGVGDAGGPGSSPADQ